MHAPITVVGIKAPPSGTAFAEFLVRIPDELINRTGQLIELAPPRIIELVYSMKKIEEGTGVFLSDKDREEKAMDFIKTRKGFRGLQEYALSLTIRGVEKEDGDALAAC